MRTLHLAAILLGVVSAGCVGDQRYRYLPTQKCEPQPNCINLPTRDPGGPGWELAYAEFNDDGGAWDVLQTKAVVDLIQKAKQDNGGAAVVVLYIHGWKNNANEPPPPTRKDVEKFKTALSAFAAIPGVSRLKAGDQLPPLVGVYIAWRGLSASVEPFKTLSMWPRRTVARGVGRHALFETMETIIRSAKPNSDDPTRVILLGHSFGARVLENAVDGVDDTSTRKGALLAWQESIAASGGTRSPSPPVDLIGFVNAATQSSISGETIARLKANKTVFYGPDGSAEKCRDDPRGDRRPECRPLPLYFAVSSTGDLATRYLLPVANLLIPAAPAPWRLRSAAFTGGLQSHEIVEVACPLVAPSRCRPEGDREMCFEANRNNQRVCYEMRRKPGATNQTPFWAMTVDPRVVTDHTDVWNQNLLDLFLAVLERSQAVNVNVRRVMARQ